jgi:hypothetical protein
MSVLPDLKEGVIVGGSETLQDEAGFLAIYPRVNGSGTITVTGTITNLDSYIVIFTSGLFSGGSLALTIGVVTADTLTTLAQKVVNAINGNSTLQSMGIFATSSGAAVTINWPGPIGNQIVISVVSSPGGTETATIVQITGGSGPVIPQKDFNYAYGGGLQRFRLNHPKNVALDFLKVLLRDGVSII